MLRRPRPPASSSRSSPQKTSSPTTSAGTPVTPSPAARSVASRRAFFDPFGLDRLEQRPRVQLAGGGGDQHVVGLGEVAAGGEGLAEGGKGEGDGAARLLGEGRDPHREERVAGPGVGPGERRQPVGGGAPLDLGHPLGPPRLVGPGVAAEAS